MIRTVGEQVRAQPWVELDPRLLHDLVKLRIDVFVVEQHCPYPELDGRDLEPGALHWWTHDAEGRPTAYLRTLQDPDGSLRIGRVCTRSDARGAGLAGTLVEAVLASVPPSAEGSPAVVLDAQSHLQNWYARYGFEPVGAEYLEDGIPHVPMRRPPRVG